MNWKHTNFNTLQNIADILITPLKADIVIGLTEKEIIMLYE